MAYENQIFGEINRRIKSKLNTKPFQKGEFYIIAELVNRGDGENIQTIPAIVDNDGECTYVGIEDKYPYQSYWRINGFKQTYENQNTFGNDAPFIKQSSEVYFVVMADRAKVQLNREEIVSLVASAFPQDLSKAFLQSISGNVLLSVDLLDLNINIDKDAIFDRECQNVSLSLPPNVIMFSVEFTLEILINQACYQACP